MANGIVGTLLILLKTRADVTGINKMEHSMDKTMRKAKGLKAIMRAGSLMSILSGTQSVGQALGNYLEFEKQLGAIHSRLFAITGDTTKAQKHFDAIRQLSLNLGQDLTSTADAFSIFFSGTARNLGEQGALEMFESWSKVGRVLHFTPYQMERVTYALREMSSKGAIYSQDLKMQLGTHVPDAVGIAEGIVDGFGLVIRPNHHGYGGFGGAARGDVGQELHKGACGGGGEDHGGGQRQGQGQGNLDRDASGPHARALMRFAGSCAELGQRDFQ